MVVLFKQVAAAIKEEGHLFEGIIEIINELLTTLIYATTPSLIEKRAAIFIGILF